MKKFKLLVLALTLSLSTLTYSAFTVGAEAALGCDDLTGCTGTANCGGRGHEDAPCVIHCDSGDEIKCGGANEQLQ